MSATEEKLVICGPGERSSSPIGDGGDPEGNSGPVFGLTENLGLTYHASGSACLDFFFQIVADTGHARVEELARNAWAEDPLLTLKLIFQLRGIRGSGKSDKIHFYDAAWWLYEHHPRTLAANIGKIPPVGYFKDLLELLQRILEGKVATAQRMLEKEDWRNLRRMKKWKQRGRKGRRFGRFSGLEKTKKNHTSCVRHVCKDSDKVIDANSRSREERIAASIAKDQAESKMAAEARKKKAAMLAGRVIGRLAVDKMFQEIYSGVAEVFAAALAKDLKSLELNKDEARISFAAKWCPSLDSAYDKVTLLCEAIARKLFPRDSAPEFLELEEEHYAYRVRDKLRKEVLVPLRKALELPEVYMSAQKWDELPYERVASVAMKRYSKHFAKHDKERFASYLDRVKAGEKKIAAGAVLPHEILELAVDSPEELVRETSEMQWRAMVDELQAKGSLRNCLSVCDVSGSMSGTPMDVCIALGLLTSELCDEPWKGHIISFSHEPALHKVEGETLQEKYQFTGRLPWAMNTDFQKVFDGLLDRACEFHIPPEKMVKRIFVFSDMEFDEARSGKGDWATTDYVAITGKFRNAGYGEPPQIVFWNLRDSQSIPVTKNQKGVALVSGFSKNILKLFLDSDGEIDPMMVLRKAVEGKIFDKLVVVD